MDFVRIMAFSLLHAQSRKRIYYMAPDSAMDLFCVQYTRNYILAFEEELERAADATTLKVAMESRFPNLGMDVALAIGSKVAKGEMAWG